MNPIRIIETFNLVVGKLFSFFVFAGMAIVVYEVIARYAFNAPSVWAPGYTQRVFAGYFILIGAYTLIKGGHVRVDILLNTRSPRWNALTEIINYLALTIWTLALTYEAWFYFVDAWEFNEVDASALRHPMWPVNLTLFIGTALIMIQGVSGVLTSSIELIKPKQQSKG
ncbi:TRAP transporter small permease subunit [Marinobacter adhaerens]|uniref:TRAP transporter small permease protein n=1 Tax=Marinobacter adhaerens TaxID=1033846 RepID=A0A851HY70_9GAMM|nr:TRAP transporter small permease subunit [Marinobacter adhaerens]NWN91875.1 TRAP transporter small permease subunit [Marinobacter adhaerens]